MKRALLLAAFALCACKGEPQPEAPASGTPMAAAPAPVPPAAPPADFGEIEPGIPRLPPQGADAAGFTPKDWRLEHQVKGDLNADGAPDLLLILQADYDENLITTGPEEDRTYDANPRIVAFALAARGGYRLAGQNHRLIPVRESITMDDPLQKPPVISNGVAVLTLTLFMSAGGGDMGDYVYRFRVQDGGVKLIGYDHHNTHRMTGETHDTSVNLLTLKRIDRTGNIGSDRKKTYNTGVAIGPIPLEMLGDGFAFEEEQLKG